MGKTDGDMPADIVVRDALLLDGTGAPSVRGGLAVRDGHIVAVGDVGALRGGVEIAASGLALAPGFIDIHTHDDLALLTHPGLTPKVSQGVTTVVTGNCGVSLAPIVAREPPPQPLSALGGQEAYRFARFADYLSALREAAPAVNVVALVGHNTLRTAHLGATPATTRPADAAERAAMRRDVEASLREGAAGFSSGLYYASGQPAPAEEVIDLARPAGEAGALYAAHIRDEADRVVEALEEAIGIAEAARCRLLLSHHKVMGAANFGRTRETLPLVERAASRAEVAMDVYPYAASSTVLNAASHRLAACTVVAWSSTLPSAAGRALADVAAELGCDEEEALIRLQPGGGIYFAMDEADVRRVLAHPLAMIGSDGLPHDVHPHPRLWGSFARVLGHYARDQALFPLAEAVRRMTALPAAMLRLADRGRLAPGMRADLVLFDPRTVADTASFTDPCQPARGIARVWVNGRETWRDGAATGARAGEILTPAWARAA